MTPHAYLNTARMLAALDRLAVRSLSITEVALEVGFETPSSFSHAFTAFVGETPAIIASESLSQVPKRTLRKLRYHDLS